MTPHEARMIKTLTQLAGLPTAAGREDAVVAWVTRWANRRAWVSLQADAYGNLTLRDRRWQRRKSGEPIVIVAHMDHPAFVAVESVGREVIAHFRGGVRPEYFVGTGLRHWSGTCRGSRAVVVAYEEDDTPGRTGPGPRVTLRFARSADVQPGDVLTWDLPEPNVAGGRLKALACDNLAGVAAALCTLEKVHALRTPPKTELRLLFTRAEEIGFVGAVSVCEDRLIPEDARVVVLEASKAFDHAPIGGGPIVRVGDRLSVFDPALTDSIAGVAENIAGDDSSFAWQRKLMDGGACEATAFAAYGYRAACVCVPLGNYHNMDETRQRISRESIATSDWLGMVRLLAALPSRSGVSGVDALSIRRRLAERFAIQRIVLDD